MITTQDILKRMDLTAGGDMTASAINQLVDTARPAEGKGLIIKTTDTDVDEPEVPNPNVLLEGITPDYWVNYLWLRIPFNINGEIKIYAWNPHITADATYLNWESITSEDLAEEIAAVQTVANDAATLAETANVNALLAISNVNSLTVEADLMQTRLAANEDLDEQQNTRLDGIDTAIENIAAGQGGIVSVARGGTGSNTPAGARQNLGLQYASRGVILLKDVKATTVVGGTSAVGTWQKRTLTNIYSIGDTSPVTLNAGSTFTLTAGVYLIEAETPAYDCGKHQCRLYDNTDNEVVNGSYGQTAFAGVNETQTVSKLMVLVTITTARTFQVEHYTQLTNGTSDLGLPTSFGGDEIYTQVKITPMNT